MRGGVELSVKWEGKTIDEAVTFFLENSMFRIFTNNSVSCITLIAKLNSGIETPFISIDSLNFAKDVNSLLLKIMPSTDTILKPAAMADKASIPGRIDKYNGIEINSYATIERETQTQKDIFRKSIINSTSFLDGLCPALVHVVNPVPDKNVWKNTFLDIKKIIKRPDKDKMSELVAINQIFSAVNMIENRPTNISIILMEFMEGYKVLNELKTHPNYVRFQQFAMYELHQLHLLGYIHGDLHTGNIMVQPDIQHFSITAEPKYFGIIKIIDFGRTAPLLPAEKLMIQSPNYDFNLIAKEKIFKSVFGPFAVLNPDISSLLQAMIPSFTAKRKEFIQQIVQQRLKPFYDFKAIPEDQRTPDKLLRALFPDSLYGGLLQTSRKTNYLNNTRESLQYIKMKEPTSEYGEDTLNAIFDFDPTYDWDEGRPIVGNTLSEKEQKMTIEDFKNTFSGILIQNDNEKTMNISQFLKDNLVTEPAKGGKKYKTKSKKNKTHKKKKYGQSHRGKSHRSRSHNRKTKKNRR
jgi:serine/threonine protein kinase